MSVSAKLHTPTHPHSLESQVCQVLRNHIDYNWLVLINPPRKPKPQQLEAMGVNPKQVLMLHPRNRRQFIQALQQGLQSTTVNSVMAWRGGLQLSEVELAQVQNLAIERRKNCLLIPPQQPMYGTYSTADMAESEESPLEALGHLLDNTVSNREIPWLEQELQKIRQQLAS